MSDLSPQSYAARLTTLGEEGSDKLSERTRMVWVDVKLLLYKRSVLYESCMHLGLAASVILTSIESIVRYHIHHVYRWIAVCLIYDTFHPYYLSTDSSLLSFMLFFKLLVVYLVVSPLVLRIFVHVSYLSKALSMPVRECDYALYKSHVY